MLYNFRDLGGLETNCERTVKPGLLFRTGNISHIAHETAQHVAQDRGIRAYIDFRTPKEIIQFGEPQTLIQNKIEWIRLPIDTDDPEFQSKEKPTIDDWLKLYHRVFEQNSDSFLKFLNIIAEADAAISYGCLFGKDRTGIASSVLLETLNVKEELIIKDYAETEKHIVPLYLHFKKLWYERSITEDEIHHHFLRTPPALMSQFLDFVRNQSVAKESKIFADHVPLATKAKLQGRLLQGF